MLQGNKSITNFAEAFSPYSQYIDMMINEGLMIDLQSIFQSNSKHRATAQYLFRLLMVLRPTT
jgi:hypothetical protein